MSPKQHCDIIIARDTTSPNCQVEIGSAVAEVCNYSKLYIQPNPVRDIVEVVLDIPIVQQYDLLVTEIMGKINYTIEMKEQNNYIDLAAFAQGVYLFKVSDINGKENFVKKVVKR